MLASEPAERKQSLLYALELLRLECGQGQRLLDSRPRGVCLGKHPFKRLGDQCQDRSLRRGLTLDAPKRRGKPRSRGPLPLQSVERLVKLGRDLLCVHHQLAARGECLFLALLWIELTKLVERMAQIAGVGAGSCDLAVVPRPLGLRRLPGFIGLGHTASLARQTAKRVNQVAMAAWIDQRAIVMLAMDLDQGLAHLPQELHAHADIVDEGAAPAVSPLYAAQNEAVSRLKPVRGEKLEHEMVRRKIEARRYLALRGAPPHQGGVSPASNGEGESIEQNRFAGAGFPGQRRKALAEFEIEFVDQDDVADRQRG